MQDLFIIIASMAGFVLLESVFPSPFNNIHWGFFGIACWSLYCLIQRQYNIHSLKGDKNRKIGPNDIVLRMAGMEWTLEDFVRGWLITGKTGSGKTAAAICNIMKQLFENVPNWGGLCVDQKGLFYKILQKAAKSFGMEDRIILLKVKSIWDLPGYKSPHTVNLIGDLEIESEVYATGIMDNAESLGMVGSGGSSDHFKSQARIHIEAGINLKRIKGDVATLTNVYDLLTSDSQLKEELQELRGLGESIKDSDYENALKISNIYNHFSEKFLGLGPDELSGVRSTILNSLHPFTHPEIAKVYCAEEPTANFKMMDGAKIICPVIPQQFPSTRTFINALCKLNFFSHGLRRADEPEEAIDNRNLLVIFNDEAQRTVVKNEQGMADHSCLDQTREFWVTGVYATQGESSFLPKLGKDITTTLILNLSNEIILTAANQWGAEQASKRIGERMRKRETKNFNGAVISHSYTQEVQPLIYPYELRALKKFEAVVCHCESGHRRVKLQPTSFTARSHGLDTASDSKEAILPEPTPEELTSTQFNHEPELSA
ncbi:MAG: type IV secretion system DNA-binding domain-containing protein [Verrucomicrobiota bacterium]